MRVAKYQSEYDVALLNPPLCACGCGEEITLRPSYRYYGLAKFIKNHAHVPWNKGLTALTDDRLKKLSDAYKGLKQSEESKLKKSLSMMGKNTGPKSEETKKKLSLFNLGKTYIDKYGVEKATAIKAKQSDRMMGKYKGKKFGPRSLEVRESISNKLSGVKKSEAHIQKVAAANSGKTRSVEARQRMSDKAVERFKNNGGINPGYTKGNNGYFFSIKNKKEIRYESSYELKAYQILEQLSEVCCYDRCKFSIAYSYNNMQHKYIPDILVTYIGSKQEILEIKPEYKLKDEINLLKFKAAKNFCVDNNLNFCVWTEKELNINRR